MESEAVWAMGLMSGTSLDGVDAALIRTDGEKVYELGPSLVLPYSDDFQDILGRTVRHSADMAKVSLDLTVIHAEAVMKLIQDSGIKAKEIKIVGFHGQTVEHRPNHGITWQIGNPALLASMTGIDVVADFRSMDVAQGGQGAPLVPLYHSALFKKQPKPLAVVNIGGISNVTWLDKDGVKNWIQAFDTGPGNAMINDLMMQRKGLAFDKDGELGLKGEPDQTALDGYFYDTFFDMPPPKTLDRFDFGIEAVLHLDVEDAVATLVHFTVGAIAKAQDFFYRTPQKWLVCGGGRHNKAIMKLMQEKLGDVQPVEALNIDGDAIEAQAIGYLAVRSIKGLPLTLPQTTGARQPVSGGAFYQAAPLA
ncbi:MAG: anhydro-N-acetylmuramic acid kinase [Rickettsiales bacterium]|nr:anhydro-N-acetylmuramic acid kinase [Rickettsiales bacterium]